MAEHHRRKVAHVLIMLAIVLPAEVAMSMRTGRKLAASPPTAGRTFMASLPLNITVSSPAELMTSRKAYMWGKQQITVVYSRPVIALGSDLTIEGLEKKATPFRLSCNFPGKIRWVTTSIARYDPDESWPTDLDCDFIWNSGLKTYDGVKVQLGDLPIKRRLASSSLYISNVNVVSELAKNLTGGTWSSSEVAYGDKAPEVPPDGHLLVYFSYTVNLKMVSAALQILEGNSMQGSVTSGPRQFTVRPCTSAAPWIATNSSLDINTTCADVEVGPLLKPDTWYTLRLPAGTKYNAVSGQLARDLDYVFAGLGPFRIPFLNPIPNDDSVTSYNAFSYRRWNMWLPHGLAAGTRASDLAAAITLCERPTGPSPPAGNSSQPACGARVPFNLTLVGPTLARLTVPRAQPGRTYRVYVSRSSTVRDGFNQKLQGSSTEFKMMDVQYMFAAPNNGGSALVVLEGADIDPQTSYWPYITRSPSLGMYGWPKEGYPRTIKSYHINAAIDADVIRLFAFIQASMDYGVQDATAVLGQPDMVLTVNRNLTTPGLGQDWTQIKAPLGSAQLQVMSECCTPVSEQRAYGQSKIVLRTNLTLSVVQSGPTLVAWVTDAFGGSGPGTVAGADVSFYTLPFGWYGYDEVELPVKLANCTTNMQGYCAVRLTSDSDRSMLAAVARVVSAAGVRTALLPYSGWVTSPKSVSPYKASIVLDRKVVEPADSVKITGFVQLASPTGLSLPNDAYILLEVVPNFNGTIEGILPLTVATLSGITGTFHAEIAVPASAKMLTYTVNAFVSSVVPNGTTPLPAVTDLLHIDDDVYLSSETFVVSSPRPPTAELKLVTDPWVTPNGSFAVNATAVSYIGASVSDSVVTVTWSLVNSGASASSVLNLTTNMEGVAAATINLAPVAAAAAAAAAGKVLTGTVSVKAEWIGPTRERIIQSSSVRIASGPVSVSISTSHVTDIPGIPFTVAAAVTSSVDGAAIRDLPVHVTMKPLSASAATCAAVAVPSATGGIANCTTSSGADWPTAAASCRLALPCVGQFLLEACVDVPYGGSTTRACGSTTRGRDATLWAAAPLSGIPEPTIFLDKPDGYRLGESPRLWLDNPYSASRMLVVWGTTYGVRTMVFTGLPAGQPFTAVIGPLGSECEFNCAMTVVLDVPRAGPTDVPILPPRSELPVSALFDPRAPHAHIMTADIRILRDNELSVEVEVTPAPAAVGAAGVTTVKDSNGADLVVVEPGATAQVTVDVGSAAADGPVEVTVYGIDKAFLDLLPYNLPKPHKEIVLALDAYMNGFQTDDYRVAPGAIRAVYDTLIARLTGLDPWLPVDTSLNSMAVDTPDDVYLAKYTSFITYSGGYYWNSYYDGEYGTALPGAGATPLFPAQAQRPPPPGSIALGGSRPDERGDGPIPSPSLALLRRVGQFVVTPLFTHVLADSTGRATFNFTAPQNLGTFVIRAFAAAGSVAKYGSGESKLVVRRSLSLTPSVPAFVRVGDVFEGGVVVTVGSAPATVTVSLQVLSGNSLRVVGTLVKQVTFTGGSGGDLQEEVRFNFNATAVGTTSLVFSASDGVLIGGGRDSLQLEIDVEGQQGAVWIATSYPLAGAATPSNPTNSTVSWVDGLELPATVPGSGGLTLSAGVGYLPALAALYDNILVSESWRTEPYAQPAVLWATLPAVLSYYGQTVNGSQATEVTAAVSDLNTLTDPVYGLCWTTYSRFSGWWTRRTDVYLNTWALFVVNFHAAVVPSVVPDVLAPKWRQALETQVVADDWEARSYNSSYSDWNMLAWIRLALGADWKPDAVASADNLTLWHVSLERTLAVYRDQETRWQFDRQTRMVLSLVLLSMGDENPEPGLVDETVTEVVSSLHTQGRTVYLGVGPGISATASPEEQALALLLLLRSGVDVPAFTSRLANYIASPSSAGRGGGIFLNLYPSLSAQALAVAALTEYDRSRGSSEPNLDLRASVGSLNVLQASFRVNETRPVTSYTTWEAMPPSSRGKPRLLSVEANGTGEAFLSAAIRFIPVALPPFPTYRGIAVELVVQLVDPLTGRPTGPHLAAVPLGSVVALTVQLTTPDDLSAVTLSVMMPGGLEPMDPNLVPDAASPCFISWFGSNEWQYCFPRWWWWPVCPAQETRPSLVTFSYAALRAGTTTATVKAVAATAGTFVVPPVRASVDEQPEVMGMTAGGSLTVCDGCSGATPAPPPRAPKACPADCSGNGVCNLLRGVCSCDDGFTNPDCAIPE